jgi:putative membrane protein
LSTADLLPHVNATLNAIACALLINARLQIAAGRIERHRRAMLAALGVSALFLLSYLAYHFSAPIFVFRGEGAIRPVYYALLISHVVLAALAIPLILATAWFGLRRSDRRHRGLARWTWLLWMYVSLSGVLVYLMLYQIYR